MCRLGYTCTYTKLIQAVVTLYMSHEQFNSNTSSSSVKDLFIQAVAAAAGVDPTDINIVSVSHQPGASISRRLLAVPPQETPKTKPAAAADGAEQALTHIQLQIHNSVALRNLDSHLQNVGLGSSAAHNWFTPHSVQVRRVAL
jgi:hypothetical protein